MTRMARTPRATDDTTVGANEPRIRFNLGPVGESFPMLITLPLFYFFPFLPPPPNPT